MLNDDFKECARLLGDHGVEYLIVGGYALAAYGHPRFTGDLDIWYRAAPENCSRLHQALEAFGFGSLGITPQLLQQPDTVLQLGYPPRRIDFLSAIDGVQFDTCWERRVIVAMGGLDLPFIGLEDFRKNKRATGRLKDLADLEALGDTPDGVNPE